METIEQHLGNLKAQKIAELYNEYQNKIRGSILVTVDKTKLTPQVESVLIRGGFESAYSLEKFVEYHIKKGLNEAELLDITTPGKPAYIVKIGEYSKIVESILEKAILDFKDYAAKQAAVGAATTVEQVFAIKLSA